MTDRPLPSAVSQPSVASSLRDLDVGYALILLAVPTLGASAVLAALRLWRRPLPTDPLAAGHQAYQWRTLVYAAFASLVGGVLILIGVGIFVLFAMAVWVLIRGAAGLMRLRAGQPITHPGGWWV